MPPVESSPWRVVVSGASGLVLHRPALLRVLPSIIRLLFGEMGKALFLDSARVLPGKQVAGGFHFLYPNLESALRHELGKKGPQIQ